MRDDLVWRKIPVEIMNIHTKKKTWIEVYKENIVIPVLIHEMAHAVTNNCGHDKRWLSAIYDIVDYFPDMNKYEANILNREIAKEE